MKDNANFFVCMTLRVLKKRLNAPFGFIFPINSEPLDFRPYKGGAFKCHVRAAPELGCSFYAFMQPSLPCKMDTFS